MSQRRSYDYENNPNDTYNSLNRSPGKRPNSNYQSINNRAYQSGKRNSFSKLNQIKDRIHSVINLCKEQNQAVEGQFSDVINYQKQILNLLNENPQLLNKVSSNRNINAQTNVQNPTHYQPIYQARQQQVTPFRVPPSHFPQSQYYFPSVQQSARGPIYPQQDFSAPQQNFAPYKPPQNAPSQNDHLQQNFNSLKNNKQIQLNQDALQLIYEIQQKAFAQIQRLRQQKILLMQRLNQEIKNFNNQRKKNIQLENLLRQKGGSPVSEGVSNNNSASENQYLRAQLVRLENENINKNNLINQLKIQLSKKGSNNIPGIQQLLRQGQVIRQETLKLLKLKESQGNGQRVKELQKQLAFQLNQKQKALNEISQLKQRLRGGNSSYRSDVNQGSSLRKSPKIQQKGNQYEDLIKEMKRMSGY